MEREGLDPSVAMTDFADWVTSVAGSRQPVFVGWNGGFDWMFVADYLERFAGRNPFGFAPLDMKAYIMGLHRLPNWADTQRAAPGRSLWPGRPDDPRRAGRRTPTGALLPQSTGGADPGA